MAGGGNPGNAVGSVQEDAYGVHDHVTHAKGTMSGYYISNNNNDWSAGGNNEFGRSHSPDEGVRTGDSGGSETRPINAYVNFIIKS